MLLIQVLLIQVSTIIIFDNLYVQNQSTTTAQALARTKTRMTTWLNSNFRGRWKEVSGPNVTLASNQWMIVMRIGKQGGNYDYHYWYRRCKQYLSGDVQRCAGIDRRDIAADEG